MSYSRLERYAGQLLDASPKLRATAKSLYLRLNYLLAAKPREALRLAEGVSSTSVAASAPDSLHKADALFFGYFGLPPWSPDGRYFVFHRLPQKSSRKLEVWLWDQDQDSYRQIGDSTAWNYQQATMAHWLPSGASPRVIFNDVEDGRLVSRVVDAESAIASHTLPWPVQASNPTRNEALSINYRRLDALRPEYGYQYEVSNFRSDQALDADGIWRFNLETGHGELIVSLQDLKDRSESGAPEESQHKVNHVVYNPAGTRFVFMHRWIGPQGKFSRLYCANAEGQALTLLMDERMVSHYTWLDDDSLLVWGRSAEGGDRYYLVDTAHGAKRIIGKDVLDAYGDGHPVFSPDGRWLVTDSYPDRARRRHLLLYDMQEERLVHVGDFFAPWAFDGAVRCDLHPRWSPDGKSLSIDSAHEGLRRTYTLDVQSIVAA